MADKTPQTESFDEGTITKLELFQLYTREWLPVFTSPREPRWTELNLFDFFAGPGTDDNGVSGSPLRTLSELANGGHVGLSLAKGLRIHVWFSDKSAAKINKLKIAVGSSGLDLRGVEIRYEAGTFEHMFPKALAEISHSSSANLVIIDQYGVSQVSDQVFHTLVALDRTDFIFFISSSFLHRFANHPSIKRYIEFPRPEDYYQVHNVVLNHYRNLIPPGREFWLAPYSIKKGSNVYGIIFGSSHPLGIEKFLRVAWRQDGTNGEANFDITREGFDPSQPTLDIVRPRKIEVFESDLREKIITQKLDNEPAIYRFCLERGMTPSHARPVIRALKQENKIETGFDVPRRKNPRIFKIIQ